MLTVGLIALIIVSVIAWLIYPLPELPEDE